MRLSVCETILVLFLFLLVGRFVIKFFFGQTLLITDCCYVFNPENVLNQLFIYLTVKRAARKWCCVKLNRDDRCSR